MDVSIGYGVIVTLFGVLNDDPINYQVVTKSQNNYMDVGLERGVSLSRDWKLIGAYKTVLGLTHFALHQFF